MLVPKLLSLTFATLSLSIPTPADDDAAKKPAPVNEIKCSGEKYAYEGLVGYGVVASNARDKYGDTLGGFGSSITLDGKSWKQAKDGSYSGIFYALPDRGW